VAGGYAECSLMLVRMFRDPSIDVDAHEEAATRLVELFEGLGDDRGSALAWEERAYAHWFRLRMKASGTAAEQALTYAKAAGIRCSRGRGPAVRAVSRPGRSGTSGAA